MEVLFKCLRQRSNGLKIWLPACAVVTCMCFLGFIRYNKTLIACGFKQCLPGLKTPKNQLD